MKLNLVLFAVLFGISASAVAADPETNQASDPAKFPAYLKVSGEIRAERQEDQALQPQSVPMVSMGLGFGNWALEAEYSKYSTSSADGSISIDRHVENRLLWGTWLAPGYRWVEPYFGAGLGQLRESVDTHFAGQSSSDQGSWSTTVAGKFGVRLLPQNWYWLSVEGRLYKNPRLDPDPTMSLVTSIGLAF